MRILLPYLMLYKQHKWILILGIVLMIITVLANICTVAFSVWLLSSSAILGTAGLYIFNYMLPIAGVRGTAIIRIFGRYFERLITHDVTFRILQDLRVFTFSCLIPLFPARLIRFQQGELLNRVVADIDTLDHLYLRVLSPLVSALMVIIIVTLGLGTLNAMRAVVLGGMMLLALFFLPPLFYYISKPIGNNLTYLRCEYRQQLIVWLQAQTELMLFGANQRYRSSMDSIELNWHKAQSKQSSLTALFQAVMTLITGFSIIVMLWMGGSESINNNSQFEGKITALFVFCSLVAFEALTVVIISFQYLGQVVSAAGCITELTKQSPEVLFNEKYTEIPERVALRLQNVTFSYDGQLQPALKDITLNIPAGKHVVIIGCTGCGKSTLLQLLTRSWNPVQGLININDIPIRDFSEATLRHIMSVVPQRVHLFSGTLKDNLLVSNSKGDINNTQKLTAILKEIGLEKLLKDQGLNTWLGQGGRQLSSGELRRLAIARAFLHDAPLMLLDEPTEGLDPTSENQVFCLLERVMKHKTVLMVTHSLRMLTNFDRIVLMDNGQIIQEESLCKSY